MTNWNIQSVEGFVQQLAVGCIAQGYWFYASGLIPDQKDPAAVDEKLAFRYGLRLSRWARARRKQAGWANIRYVRHGHFFVLLATHGRHEFFVCEPFRDVREKPIRFGGYSIGCGRGVDGKWHASVRIHPIEYRKLKAHFLELAAHRNVGNLVQALRRIPFEPYAPVRRQLLNVLRAINRKRETAGLEPIPTQALRLRRHPCRVYAFPATPATESVACGGIDPPQEL